MVSGYIGGENVGALQVEVETMQFITPACGNEGAGLPRTPSRTRFDIPMGFVFLMLLHPSLLIYFCRTKGKANTSPRHNMFFGCFFFTFIFFSSSPLAIHVKHGLWPLSQHPVPMGITADETAAVSSTPTPTAKQTRTAMKQTGKSRTATPVELSTAGEDDGLPAVKRQKTDWMGHLVMCILHSALVCASTKLYRTNKYMPHFSATLPCLKCFSPTPTWWPH